MVQIYAFEHIISRKAYIGCTKGNLAKRGREHRCLLRSGRHTDKTLQAEWDKMGDGFKMISLEIVERENRQEAELRWMQAYGDRCLNTHRISFRPTEEAVKKGVAKRAEQLRGSTQSAESNLKRSLAQLGKPKGHGAKISATKRAKAAMR